jgi:hypothetical protein
MGQFFSSTLNSFGAYSSHPAGSGFYLLTYQISAEALDSFRSSYRYTDWRTLMSWYLWQSRSKDDYYDYETQRVPKSWRVDDILLFPVFLIAVLIYIILIELTPFLAGFLWYLKHIYTTTRETYKTGRLAHPLLANLGIFLLIILAGAFHFRPQDGYGHLTAGIAVATCYVLLHTIIPYCALGLYWLIRGCSFIHKEIEAVKIQWLPFESRISESILYNIIWNKKTAWLSISVVSGLVLGVIVLLLFTNKVPDEVIPPVPAQTIGVDRVIKILVDDFDPQPLEGDSQYYYNRLGGDRGSINDSVLEWGDGQVTTSVSSGKSWGGVWMSLNHPIRESLPVDFSAVLPHQIKPEFQSQITGLRVEIPGASPDSHFKIELKNRDVVEWKQEVTLSGGEQILAFQLPPLGEINHLVWILDQATVEDFVILDSVSYTATTQILDTPTAAFVWSYGMLLENWNPETGLVRDKARDASGEFDAVQATGSLAAATAVAEQLGIIEHEEAVQIVEIISETLLSDLPRFHGLWPHWVKTSSEGEITIVENTEWSSVDTVIAGIGLLGAQSGLGLDTTGVERFLQAIDWRDLVTPSGISHGYGYSKEPLPYAWDVFGGETWLVELVYAAVTGEVTGLSYPKPPSANGSGFIDELAWLFVPPPREDYWGADWLDYRHTAADKQLRYFPENYPESCLIKAGLFGLSAAEVPSPWIVPKVQIYQAFGLGGRFEFPKDGTKLLGAPVVTPHYSAMVTPLQPEAALRMWDWLSDHHFFTPLNNVESLMLLANSTCSSNMVKWNHLKGSWNLALQTLGWGRYLAHQSGKVPILWQAVDESEFLSQGYKVLTTKNPNTSLTLTSSQWKYERECEYPDEAAVGQAIQRSNASASLVHGQFGTESSPPWTGKPGFVKYAHISIPQADQLNLKIRYSKFSPSSVPIQIYIDEEEEPRAIFDPIDQGNWDQFVWSEEISLGSIDGGDHSLLFSTDGQQYGVADLDSFLLESPPVQPKKPSILIAIYKPLPDEIPTTPIWDNNQVTCEGKPLHEWSSPGIYIFKKFMESGISELVTVEQKTTKERPGEGKCSGMPWPDFGDRLPEPSVAGYNSGGFYDFCELDRSRPPGSVSITVVGIEDKKFALGTFKALLVETVQEYHWSKSINNPRGTFTTREWYVCGYGLMQSTTSHIGKYQERDFQKEYGLELISFTPISTNESHVRYILTDIQLGNIDDEYQAKIADEETAEALRRWDAGIRVENITEFERRIVNRQWVIVYKGSENPIKGEDVTLTSDPT